MTGDALQTSHGWRRSVLNRVGVFTASPVAAFLALLLELLLSFGISEAKTKLDPVTLAENAVKLANNTFSNFARLKSAHVS